MSATTAEWNENVCDRLISSARCLGSPGLVAGAGRVHRFDSDQKPTSLSGSCSDAQNVVEKYVPEANKLVRDSVRFMTSGTHNVGLARFHAIDKECDKEIAALNREHELQLEKLRVEESALADEYAKLSERKSALENRLLSARTYFESETNKLPSDAMLHTFVDAQALLANADRSLDSVFIELIGMQRKKAEIITHLVQATAKLHTNCNKKKELACQRMLTAVIDLQKARSFLRASECHALTLLRKDPGDDDSSSSGEEEE